MLDSTYNPNKYRNTSNEVQNITGDINPQSAVARPCKAVQGCQMMGKAVKWCAKGCVPCVRCSVLCARAQIGGDWWDQAGLAGLAR